MRLERLIMLTMLASSRYSGIFIFDYRYLNEFRTQPINYKLNKKLESLLKYIKFSSTGLSCWISSARTASEDSMSDWAKTISNDINYTIKSREKHTTSSTFGKRMIATAINVARSLRAPFRMAYSLKTFDKNFWQVSKHIFGKQNYANNIGTYR